MLRFVHHRDYTNRIFDFRAGSSNLSGVILRLSQCEPKRRSCHPASSTIDVEDYCADRALGASFYSPQSDLEAITPGYRTDSKGHRCESPMPHPMLHSPMTTITAPAHPSLGARLGAGA